MAQGVGFDQVRNMMAQVQGADANIAAEITAGVARIERRVALRRPRNLPTSQQLAEINVKCREFATPAKLWGLTWVVYPITAEKCAALLRTEHANRLLCEQHIDYLQQKALVESLVASQMISASRAETQAARAERDAHERTINGPNGNDGLRQNLAAAQITIQQRDLAAIATNAQLLAITGQRDAATADLAARTQELAARTQERDGAVASLAARTQELAARAQERDEAVASLAVRTQELAARTQERNEAQRQLQQEREGNQKLLQVVDSADACIQRLKTEMQAEQHRWEAANNALRQQIELVSKSKEELAQQTELLGKQKQELEQQNGVLKGQNTAAELQLARLQERSRMQVEKEQQQRLFIIAITIGVVAYVVLQIGNSLRYR